MSSKNFLVGLCLHSGPSESGHAGPAAAPDGNGLLGCHQRVAGCEKLASGYGAVLESTAARSGRCGKFDAMHRWNWSTWDGCETWTGRKWTESGMLLSRVCGNTNIVPFDKSSPKSKRYLYHWMMSWKLAAGNLARKVELLHPWLEFLEVLWLVVPEGFKNLLPFRHFGRWLGQLSTLQVGSKTHLSSSSSSSSSSSPSSSFIFFQPTVGQISYLLAIYIMSNFWSHTQVSQFLHSFSLPLLFITSIISWETSTLDGSSPVSFSNKNPGPKFPLLLWLSLTGLLWPEQIWSILLMREPPLQSSQNWFA